MTVPTERNKDSWCLGAGLALPAGPRCCCELAWRSQVSVSICYTQIISHNINIRLGHSVTMENWDTHKAFLLSCVNTEKMTKHSSVRYSQWLLLLFIDSFSFSSFEVRFTKILNSRFCSFSIPANPEQRSNSAQLTPSHLTKPKSNKSFSTPFTEMYHNFPCNSATHSQGKYHLVHDRASGFTSE